MGLNWHGALERAAVIPHVSYNWPQRCRCWAEFVLCLVLVNELIHASEIIGVTASL